MGGVGGVQRRPGTTRYYSYYSYYSYRHQPDYHYHYHYQSYHYHHHHHHHHHYRRATPLPLLRPTSPLSSLHSTSLAR